MTKGALWGQMCMIETLPHADSIWIKQAKRLAQRQVPTKCAASDGYYWNRIRGQDWDETSEVQVSGTKLKEVSKHSVIKVNFILIQYLKKWKLMQKFITSETLDFN